MRVLEQETPANDPSPKLAEVVVSVAVRGASSRNGRRQLRITQCDNGDSNTCNRVRKNLCRVHNSWNFDEDQEMKDS